MQNATVQLDLTGAIKAEVLLVWIDREILVAPRPAATVAGVKVVVEPVGTPLAVSVILAGNVALPTGVTTRL